MKAELETVLEARKAALLDSRINELLKEEWLDVTLAASRTSRSFEPDACIRSRRSSTK